MMPFRDAVNTRKAFKNLGIQVERAQAPWATRSNRFKGKVYIRRDEVHPAEKLRSFLPWAHQVGVMKGFSSLTNRSNIMDSKLDRLIKLNSKLDDIVRFDHNSATEDIAAAGTGVGLGIGGYKALKAIRKKQFSNAGVLVGGPNEGATTARSFGGAVKDVASDVYHAAPGALKSGAESVGKKALSGWDAILRSLKLARVPG